MLKKLEALLFVESVSLFILFIYLFTIYIMYLHAYLAILILDIYTFLLVQNNLTKFYSYLDIYCYLFQPSFLDAK